MAATLLETLQTLDQTPKETTQNKRDLLFEMFKSFTQVSFESEQGLQIKEEFETIPEDELDNTLSFCFALVCLKDLKKSDIKTDSDKLSVFTAQQEIKQLLEDTKVNHQTQPDNENLPNIRQMLEVIVSEIDQLL